MNPPGVRSAAIAVLILAECFFLLFIVTFGWTFRSLMLNLGDPEIAIRTRTVGINAVWLLLNVLAAVAYVLKHDGFGRYAILVVLALDVLNALYSAVAAFVTGDPGIAIKWVVEALIPAAAALLVWRSTVDGKDVWWTRGDSNP